ncbi:hypothetical protein [Kangiella sp. HZ709]|uniref:hypothetical protein n=1 Tax=Kangiella sp. HZ709 TaxID=2666328 RepID=UPI0012B0398C|nr:hypothetical protein [Kangiella sp. HZ709]MRX27132.1 hypothetical protein [Kangiella sp. HZ709]
MNKTLKVFYWTLFFAMIFITGFIGIYYYLDDAQRKTAMFCERFEIGASIGMIEAEGQKFESGFVMNKEQTSAGLYLSSGVMTFAGCDLKFKNSKLISKEHWVD